MRTVIRVFILYTNVEVTGYTEVLNVKVREKNQTCVLLFEPEQVGVFVVWFLKLLLCKHLLKKLKGFFEMWTLVRSLRVLKKLEH